MFVWGLCDGFYEHCYFKNYFLYEKVLYVCLEDGVKCVVFVCVHFKVVKMWKVYK